MVKFVGLCGMIPSGANTHRAGLVKGEQGVPSTDSAQKDILRGIAAQVKDRAGFISYLRLCLERLEKAAPVRSAWADSQNSDDPK